MGSSVLSRREAAATSEDDVIDTSLTENVLERTAVPRRHDDRRIALAVETGRDLDGDSLGTAGAEGVDQHRDPPRLHRVAGFIRDPLLTGAQLYRNGPVLARQPTTACAPDGKR
jgi:hypothetical protein